MVMYVRKRFQMYKHIAQLWEFDEEPVLDDVGREQNDRGGKHVAERGGRG